MAESDTEQAEAEEADAEWRAAEAAAQAAFEAAEAAEAAAAQAEEEQSERMAARRAKIALLRGCAQAAQAISDADVLMLCTGAGWSADSGLAVYGDIAKIPAYQSRGLQYHDICDPHWLEAEPSLFYGFWGTCFNDYRSTRPHKGYEIIAAWRNRLFRDSDAASEIRQRIINSQAESKPGPYRCDGHAGAFFLFTSNVDAHSFDHFEACEVRECHGNTELWQCSSERCDKTMWRAPLDYSFQVDLETMLAPANVDVTKTKEAAASKELEEAAASEDLEEAAASEELEEDKGLKATSVTEVAAPEVLDEGNGQEAPRAGRVRREERIHMLRGLPPLDESTTLDVTKDSFREANRPRCVKCGRLARPAILMFGDLECVDDTAQELRWIRWIRAVEEEAKVRASANSEEPLKVCVLEIGCGKNVPTCRMQSKDFGVKMTRAGAASTLIRINQDFPGTDVNSMMAHSKVEHIPVRGGSLESIVEIDAAMRNPAAALEAAQEMLAGLEAEDKRKPEPSRLTKEERLAAVALD